MAQLDHRIQTDETHPIDIAETVALCRGWEFQRMADDQIAVTVRRQWRDHALTLAWSGRDEMLRLICCFDLDPPEARMPALYQLLNFVNDEVWDGSFAFWPQQRVMVWRYGLVLSGQALAEEGQIDCMIRSAVENCERFHPSFQSACRGGEPEAALALALPVALARAA
ncbi:YbjN domain-containing protein [Paracoccus niistensis]|uniref:YbjN domain-containing protein n=1 Tax=Paracoccus niistensis TaxID=632935 RepID=A0ABV6I317_9RHOB